MWISTMATFWTLNHSYMGIDTLMYIYIYTCSIVCTYIYILYIYISTTSIGMGDIMYSNNHNKGASGP